VPEGLLGYLHHGAGVSGRGLVCVRRIRRQCGAQSGLKPIWAAVGPEITALLKKYGPKIAEGSEAALAAFRAELARLVPQAIERLPASVRLNALDGVLPHLEKMPRQVQKDLIKMRAEAILKPNGKYVGSYDAKTGILTVDDPAALARLYKQLKAGGEPAPKAYVQKDGSSIGQGTQLPGGGFVGLKNKPKLANPGRPTRSGRASISPFRDST
jgi:hypothetical protein